VRYFRRRWDEDRGDEYASWGPATYYFEVDDDLYPTRQLEVYERGPSLRYSSERLNDAYGLLSDQRLDLEDFASFEIDGATFEAAWVKS
jgi:hypothetical protein